MRTKHRRNLRKLRDYLRGPLHEGSEFSMYYYAEPSHRNATVCGSVGCAVGHGPYAGIVKEKHETWGDYCDRVFGAVEDGCAPDEEKYRWSWLFDANWGRKFNTKEAAVKRIDALLKYGTVQALVDSMGDLDSETREMVEYALEVFDEEYFAEPQETQE